MFLNLKEKFIIYKMTKAKAAILNVLISNGRDDSYRELWNWPFQIRTIPIPNFLKFGIGMEFGIPSSDLELPL